MQIKSFKKLFLGKTIRKFLSFLLTFALSFCMLSGMSTTTQAATTANKGSVYVALGDSVPAGYGLSDTKDGCVQLFSNKMEESGYSNKVYNYAKSGDTTGMLLTKLQNMQSKNPKALKAIKSASVITINIGGNNVLGPLVQAVNSNLEQQYVKLGITNIKDATPTQLLLIAASLLNLNLDNTQMEQIEKGAQSFTDDFPKIIKWVKTNAPSANIIVNTIYNPIPNSLNFYKTSEPLLQEMNAVITKGAKQNGYYAADIYSAFVEEQAKKTQIINLNLGQYSSPMSIDIHPNMAGHELIAKVHNDIFQTIPTIVKTNSKVPVAASISLPGEVSMKGTLLANITEQQLKAVIERAQIEATRLGRANDDIAVIFNNTKASVKSVNVTFDAATIDLMKAKGLKKITIHTAMINLSLDQEAIKTIDKETKSSVTVRATPITKLSKAAIKLIGSRPTFEILIRDSYCKSVTDLGNGKINLSIRYSKNAKEKTDSLFAVLINSKGQPKLLTGSSFANGWVSCTSNIISTYGVGYK